MAGSIRWWLPDQVDTCAMWGSESVQSIHKMMRRDYHEIV